LNIEEGEDLDEKASFLSRRREDALIKIEYYLSLFQNPLVKDRKGEGNLIRL
jgi:hypothetical protein